MVQFRGVRVTNTKSIGEKLRTGNRQSNFLASSEITLGSFPCRLRRHFASQKRETFRVFVSERTESATKKHTDDVGVFFLLVTRTGIEPMLLP